MKFVKWSVTREVWNSVPGNRRAHPTSHALRVLWISSGKKTYVLNRDFPQIVSPTQRLLDIKREAKKNNWRRKRVYLQTGQRKKLIFPWNDGITLFLRVALKRLKQHQTDGTFFPASCSSVICFLCCGGFGNSFPQTLHFPYLLLRCRSNTT